MVQNGLDEEELQFKERVDRHFDDDDEEDDLNLEDEFAEFSARDLDRLSMLEKYRNNLIAGVSSNIEEDKEVDDLRI